MQILFDMPPSVTMNDLPDGVSRNSIFLSKIGLSFAAVDSATYVNDLLFVQLRHAIVCAILRFIPVLGFPVGVIVGNCAKPEMGRIHTRGIVATVTNTKPVGNGATMHLITNAAGDLATPIGLDRSVALTQLAPVPLPAFIGAAFINLLPESLFERVANRVRRAPLMPINVTHRLAFDVAVQRAIFVCYLGLLTATAVAIAVGDFVRGMIGHVSLLIRLTTPPNDSRRCGGNFIGCYSFIIPQETAHG